MSNLHHIVIVGGGAGGLELATQLGDTIGKSSKAKITLVDQKLTHIWKPLLHEIAAGTMNPNDEETNYYAHSAKHHYEFVLGRFEKLDREQKIISLSKTQSTKYDSSTDSYTLSYDTLILAVGSVSNDFNTPGVKDYCHYLDSRKQADIFQQDLLHLYLDAQNKNIDRDLKIAVIGAGATGVELSAELVEAKQNFYKYGLNKINPQNVQITLIEGADRILPALTEKIAAHANQQLQRMKIEVLTAKRVEKVDADKVWFTDGTSIDAQLKVWAAGIQTPSVIANLEGFNQDRMGRLDVYATLQTKADPSIFAFGDCACCILDAREPPLGPRAQVASQQAVFFSGSHECSPKWSSATYVSIFR